MTSTTGYNHLFWHEFRSLPKGSVGIRIHSAILLCQRSTTSILYLSGKHLLPNCVPFRPIRRALLPYLAVDVFADGTQDVRP